MTRRSLLSWVLLLIGSCATNAALAQQETRGPRGPLTCHKVVCAQPTSSCQMLESDRCLHGGGPPRCPAIVNVPNGTSCNDGNVCTTGDVCNAGACGGAPAVCSSPTDICSPSTGCATTCGPAGCTVLAANGFMSPSLTVPPGALASTIAINMVDQGGDAGNPSVFHVYSFGPAGTKFATPATVNLPAPPLTGSEVAVIEVSDNGTTWTEIATTASAGRVTGLITHFSFCRTRARATTVTPEQLVVTDMVQYQDLVQVKPTTGLAIPPSGETGSCYSGDFYGLCFKLTNTSATTTITSACPVPTPNPAPAGCRQLTVAPWQCYTRSPRPFPAAFTPAGAGSYEDQHCDFTGLLIPCAEAVYNLDNFLPAGGLLPGASIWADLSFLANATPLARGTPPASGCFGSTFVGFDVLLREPSGSDAQGGIRSANDGVCVDVAQGTQFFIKSTPDTCIPGAPLGTFTCTSPTGCRVSWASLTSGTANLPTLRCLRPGTPPTPIACSQFQAGDVAYKNWLTDTRE